MLSYWVVLSAPILKSIAVHSSAMVIVKIHGPVNVQILYIVLLSTYVMFRFRFLWIALGFHGMCSPEQCKGLAGSEELQPLCGYF